MIRLDGKNEAEKGHMHYETMPFDNLINFLKGVIFQGNRLLESPQSNNDDMLDLLKLEEEFFIFALERVKFYMSMLVGNPEIAYIFEQLNDVVGHEAIKDIRDMRTHVDDYIYKGKKKKGNAQERFFITPENMPENIPLFLKGKPISIDATSSIKIGDWYLIGGRVDFFKTMDFLKEILPSVEKICKAEKMKIFQSHNNHSDIKEDCHASSSSQTISS